MARTKRWWRKMAKTDTRKPNLKERKPALATGGELPRRIRLAMNKEIEQKRENSGSTYSCRHVAQPQKESNSDSSSEVESYRFFLDDVDYAVNDEDADLVEKWLKNNDFAYADPAVTWLIKPDVAVDERVAEAEQYYEETPADIEYKEDEFYEDILTAMEDDFDELVAEAEQYYEATPTDVEYEEVEFYEDILTAMEDDYNELVEEAEQYYAANE